MGGGEAVVRQGDAAGVSVAGGGCNVYHGVRNHNDAQVVGGVIGMAGGAGGAILLYAAECGCRPRILRVGTVAHLMPRRPMSRRR